MWQFILGRAFLMFAQVVTATPAGVPAAAGTAPAGAPAPVPMVSPVAGTVNQPPVNTGVSYKFTVWHTIFLIIYFMVCVGLVVAVLLQTTKSEGLSGIIGGSSKSVFKGKKGFEEMLQICTNVLAISFLVLSLVLSIFMFRT